MGVSSDPAGALDKMMCIAWVPPLKDEFDSSEHLSGTPGVYDLAPGHFHFNAKMPFNPCDRIYCNSFSHMFSSLPQGIVSKYFKYVYHEVTS
jgi:hypothetical protein